MGSLKWARSFPCCSSSKKLSISKRVLWPLRSRVMCPCFKLDHGDNCMWVIHILNEWEGCYFAHTCREEAWLWNTSLNCSLAAYICVMFFCMATDETWLGIACGTSHVGLVYRVEVVFKFLCIESMGGGGVKLPFWREGRWHTNGSSYFPFLLYMLLSDRYIVLQ